MRMHSVENFLTIEKGGENSKWNYVTGNPT